MTKITILAILFFARAIFASGTTIGNGGDEIRFKFAAARGEAVQRIRNFKTCSSNQSGSRDVESWISRHASQLIGDITKSRHQWITSPALTCAWTNPSPYSDIVLSYQRCEQNISLLDAARLLIHESVHHLGVTDEMFADEVSTVAIGYSLGAVCRKTTLPEEVKWKVRARLMDLLPSLNGERTYWGTYAESGGDCTVLLQTGPMNTSKGTIDGFIVHVLNGRFRGSATGLGIVVLANGENSPYPYGYVTYYKDSENILSMDYIEKHNGRITTASSLVVDYSRPEIMEVAITNGTTPLKPVSARCVISL